MRYRRNKIARLNRDSVRIEQVEQVKGKLNIILRHSLRSNIGEFLFWRKFLFRIIRSEKIASLKAPFSEEEVKDVVWYEAREKSHVKYVFNLFFLKEFWEILKGDLLRFGSEFHLNARVPKDVNAYLLP